MMRTNFILLIFLCSIGYVKAQVAHPMNVASKLMKKSNPDYNPSQALSIYMELAAKGNAQAMNAVGMIHHFGLTGPENEQLALSWYENAGNAGYAKGWYNAGVVYKNRLNAGGPDFVKAFDCFSKAAAQHAYLGFYAMGYMYYKGLGCTQSYDSAVSYFRRGIARGSTGSQYMLGICFRNGYGIPVNEDSARFWLSKASQKGYKAASLELETDSPEFNRSTNAAQTVEVSSSHIARNVEAARTLSKDVNIAGRFKGYLIRYDYSGQHVLAQQPLEVSLSKNQEGLNGTWIENGSGAIKIAGKISDSSFVFNNSGYLRQDHYSAGKPVSFEFRDAALQYSTSNSSIYLFGNIRQFDKDRNEPEKPIYIMLERIASSEPENLQEGNTSSAPYPNPFRQQLTIDLNMKQSAKVILQIISANGVTVWTKDFGQLSNGMHTLQIAPNITSGPYFLKVTTGGSSVNHLIIKR